jgi:glutathione S-transferase
MPTAGKVILYYSPRTRAFPVWRALQELGSRYELEIIDLKQGDQRKDEYRRLNPTMKVPALRDDEVVVTETGAVLLYVAENLRSTLSNIHGENIVH